MVLSIDSFEEPKSCPYLYINPETNQVHLLLPLVNGQIINYDNTCQSAVELKRFFLGVSADYKKGIDPKPSGITILEDYQRKLEHDIDLLRMHRFEFPSTILRKKEERFLQIQAYLQALKQIFPQIQQKLCPEGYSPDLPFYPQAVLDLLDKQSNVFSIRIATETVDTSTRTNKPVFTVERDKHKPRPLYNALCKAFQNIPKDENIEDRFVNDVVELFFNIPKPNHLTKLHHLLKIMNQEYEKIEENFLEIKNLQKNNPKIQLDNNEEEELKALILDPFTSKPVIWHSTRDTVEQTVDTILAKLSDLFQFDKYKYASPFYKLNKFRNVEHFQKRNHLVLAVQFLIAEINVYAKAYQFSDENFGYVLESSPNLLDQLMREIQSTFKDYLKLPRVIFNFINKHQDSFELVRRLNNDDFNAIEQRYHLDFDAIEHFEQFDEFILFYPEAGDFFSYRGKISFHFLSMLKGADKYLYWDMIRRFPHLEKDIANLPKLLPEAESHDFSQELIQINRDLIYIKENYSFGFFDPGMQTYQDGIYQKMTEIQKNPDSCEIEFKELAEKVNKIKKDLDASVQIAALKSVIHELQHPDWFHSLINFLFYPFYALTVTSKIDRIETAIADVPLIDRLEIYTGLYPDHISDPQDDPKDTVLLELARYRSTGEIPSVANYTARSFRLFVDQIQMNQPPSGSQLENKDLRP